MEDRYLYKAKTTPKEKGEFNNVWVTGNLIVSNGKYYIHPVGNVVNVKNEIGRIIVMHEVIPDTICQCTGLKDKSGKLIWENDVVRVTINSGSAICRCAFADTVAQFQLWQEHTIKRTSTVLNLGNYECEVIGNIFDNKELLESEEK